MDEARLCRRKKRQAGRSSKTGDAAVAELMSAIVIIGGGPAGLALAAGLSHLVSAEITVIEKSTYADDVSGEHLQSQILPLLDRLNVPAEILSDNSTACDGIFGSWANRAVESKSLFNLYGHDYIVHRPQFERALADDLKKKGVEFYLGAMVNKIEKGKIFIKNKALSYDYLFDCSGRLSQNFDNQRLIFDQLIGVSFFTASESNDNAKILIESAENGWWYYTQSKHRKILTFFTDADIYRRLRKDLQKELDKTNLIKDFYPKLNCRPLVKAAYTSILQSNPEDVLQIGDAYYSLDPLSSQGIYKAFGQALKLANLFSDRKPETSTFEFYAEQKREFFEHLHAREYHYHKGWLYHQSEFYERRLKLNLSGLFSDNKASH
jgi:flavin-dependent dehydrogenase